jgi:HK97 family phage major capsid protein
MPTAVTAQDEMIRRLQTELDEKTTLVNGIIQRANAGGRDLDESESEILTEARSRMGSIKGQLEQIEGINREAFETRSMSTAVDQAVQQYKGKPVTGEVEYRSGGEYILDIWNAHNGNREAGDRLETYYRAAAHQKTSDNLGLIPDPVVGEVINFIDAARPLVSTLGPRPLTSATFHRPRVTQHTAVGKQGAAGGKTDEKSELTSQKMVIDRLTAEAVTYGGYVNVSRQNIDFSTPAALDLIVNDLAAQYAIETEAATCDLLATTATTAVNYDETPSAGDTIANQISGAIWNAAAVAYTAVRGQGRLVLAVAPDRLGAFGRLFAPVNPLNAQSAGFNANSFAQGAMGTISGVSLVMSAGLSSGEAFLFSTAALEVYEQRVGTLQAVEPSVAGVQVAYLGYFTPLMINDDAIVPLVAA